MRTKKKPGKRPIAKELPPGEIEKILQNIGKLIKESRQVRSSLEDFAYEINISRSALARYEAGGDMLLSSFLKVVYGLEIEPEAFFKKLN
ncbi:MAG TPA: XRE family transcriptional regulator [Patescibacteria group bacterium]